MQKQFIKLTKRLTVDKDSTGIYQQIFNTCFNEVEINFSHFPFTRFNLLTPTPYPADFPLQLNNVALRGRKVMQAQ